MSDARPLLVGESNPYGSAAEWALYPEPRGCSGDRLCRVVMGLQPEEYLRRFERTNLCRGEFVLSDARHRAVEILSEPEPRTLVLLGAKVALAFCVQFEPFRVTRVRPVGMVFGPPTWPVVVLPHPSGRCRTWNSAGAIDRARAALREAGVL